MIGQVAIVGLWGFLVSLPVAVILASIEKFELMERFKNRKSKKYWKRVAEDWEEISGGRQKQLSKLRVELDDVRQELYDINNAERKKREEEESERKASLPKKKFEVDGETIEAHWLIDRDGEVSLYNNSKDGREYTVAIRRDVRKWTRLDEEDVD